MKKKLLTIGLAAIAAILPCGAARAIGTASGTPVAATVTMAIYNATATTAAASTSATVIAVYGFSTSTFTEETAKNAVAGATATYDFTILNNSNTSANVGMVLGAQSFSGPTGPTTEWAVAAERVGTGFLNFGSSGYTLANQAGDTATATAVAASSSLTFRLHNKTSASALDTASTTYSVTLRTNDFPGAPYTGYNGVKYAGPGTWSRQLDGGLVITTINGVVLSATKTFTVAAPAAYVTAGGGATDPIPGAALQYNIIFSNTGAVAASGMVITDALPTYTTFTAGSIQSCFTGTACIPASDPDADGANPDCYYAAGPPRIICNADTLSSGGGGVLKYTAKID